MKKDSRKIRLVHIISLGCPKNFVDTEQAAASLFLHGFGITPDSEEADVCFINTCAFLQSARDEAAKTIREAEEWKSRRPGRILIAAGCLAAWDKAGTYRKQFRGVDAWLPVSGTHALGETLEAVLNAGELPVCNPSLDAPRMMLTPEHYAWLRIADGCDNCCTYCLIPSIRGSLHSRKEKDVVAEAKNLLDGGVKELLVIAQDSAAYGRDFNDGKTSFASLVKKLDNLKGDFLLRLMYLHPASVTKDLIQVMSKAKHLVRCLEMPIQHISDPVLKAMNRHIDEPSQRAVLNELRELGFSIRTTLMTGFPGETEEDFQKLYDFTKEMQFERLGVFAWSAEPGTKAAGMKKLFVPEDVREQRRNKIMRLQQRISRKRNQEMIGQAVPVIVDEVNGDGTGQGRTLFDIPEIDNNVTILNMPKRVVPGDLLSGIVEAAGAYEIRVSIKRSRNHNK